MDTTEKSSHKQILKATGIVGGAQVISILIRMLRNKVIAVLMGPAGYGIHALYQRTLDLIRSATGFGIQYSAVRDIAEAAGTDDHTRISRTVLILRRWVWFTGLLGLVLTAVFSKPISLRTFGDEKHTWGILGLSVILLLEAITGGNLAFLQGLRRISSMAKANVLGVLAGFIISVPLYWFFGFKGIVPALLVASAVNLLLSWLYTRKIPVEHVPLTLKETCIGGLSMVRLGFFLVITGFATTAAMYLVMIFVTKKSGIKDVGQYQAAWTLSLTYVGLVLQAMGADYFPRLSAVNHDNTQVIKLVNEQTEIALLIAGPLVVGMLSFVAPVVYLLYSTEFDKAINILHWQLAGSLLKVLSWPMAFILLSKKKGILFLVTELSWNIIFVTLVYFGWEYVGLEITGVSFFISFVLYNLILLLITRKLCQFRWGNRNIKFILVFGVFTFVAFLNSRYVLGMKGYFAGGILSLCVVVYSFFELHKIVDLKEIYKKFLNKLPGRN